MSLEPRDFVLVAMGGSFGAVLLLAGEVSPTFAVLDGASFGALGAVSLCFLMKSRYADTHRERSDEPKAPGIET